jgi:SAM-dependent methyltransferase
MKSSFDRDYFEAGVETGVSLYSNYRWMPELTIPFAAHICELLSLRWGQSVLDFGCAKGYLVHALRLLHREAYGYDISPYAIRAAPQEVYPYVSTSLDQTRSYDWIIAKDVLEHVPMPEIVPTLKILRDLSKKMFVIVPLGEDGKYVIPAMHSDVTHEIAEDINWWTETLVDGGFSVWTACHRIEGMKDHWASYEKGHAFLTCT